MKNYAISAKSCIILQAPMHNCFCIQSPHHSVNEIHHSALSDHRLSQLHNLL